MVNFSSLEEVFDTIFMNDITLEVILVEGNIFIFLKMFLMQKKMNPQHSAFEVLGSKSIVVPTVNCKISGINGRLRSPCITQSIC